jgi:hypothetical protein
MKTSSKLWLAGGLAAALLTLTACSGGSDDGSGSGSPQGSSGPGPGPTATTTVPDSAGSTVAAFMAYMVGMVPNDETSEPLQMKDAFVVPSDEGSDSQPLS